MDNGTLKELTRRYEHFIRGYGVDKWGAKDFDETEFVKGLATIQTLPICQGCLKGGGNDECKIRPCASERKKLDCTKCNEFMKCKNSEALDIVRTGAAAVGMLMKISKNKADQQLIKKLTVEIKAKFPYCLLFSHNQKWLDKE